MSNRDLLLKAVRNETTPRPAWVPFVGVHGGKLIGETATDYLNSSQLLVAGLTRAVELYHPDGLPIAFDLQLEAEALGCALHWSDNTPPAVVSHPLADGQSIADLPAFSAGAGRFPQVLEAAQIAKKNFSGEVALYGLICGPFTLATHLLGNDIFLEMFDHPDYVSGVVAYCAAVGCKAADAYIHHGADVVAVVDPMTSQISPAHFKEFVAPHVNHVFSHIREAGSLSSLFVCGDATRNLEAMSRTACDNLSVDENIALDSLRDITRSAGKSFGGNIKLTTALLLGDQDDAKLDAIRCIDIGGRAGFILAPGCDLPYDTPEENLMAVADIVRDEYQREIAKRTIVAKTATAANTVELPCYENEPHVTVDVVTLDSASCAPCQYMMEACRRAAQEIEQPVVIREHRIATRAGIAMMGKLNVTSIPSVCIDGAVVFSSAIPDRATLVQAILERVAAKGPTTRLER